MKKEFLNKTTIGALLVTLGFFLPWLNSVIFKVSGFEIPNYFVNMENLFDIFNEESSDNKNVVYALYLFYLIPLAGGNILYCIFSETTKFIKSSKIILLIMFSIIFSGLILSIFKLGFKELSFVGIGLYMTIIGCVLIAMDFIKQYRFNQSMVNSFIDVTKAIFFSRVFKIVVVFVGLFVLLFISNPNQAKFEEKISEIIDEHTYVRYDDYLLFSVGKLKIKDDYETVGFGCFFNVFITNDNIDTLSKKTIVSKKIKISEQKKDILKPKTVQLGLVEGDYILVNTNSSEPSTVKNKINIKLVGENEIMISDYVDPIEFTKKVKEDKITLNFGEYEQEGGDWTGGGEIVITNDNVKYKSIDGPGAEIISNYQKVE